MINTVSESLLSQTEVMTGFYYYYYLAHISI